MIVYGLNTMFKAQQVMATKFGPKQEWGITVQVVSRLDASRDAFVNVSQLQTRFVRLLSQAPPNPEAFQQMLRPAAGGDPKQKTKQIKTTEIPVRDREPRLLPSYGEKRFQIFSQATVKTLRHSGLTDEGGWVQWSVFTKGWFTDLKTGMEEPSLPRYKISIMYF